MVGATVALALAGPGGGEGERTRGSEPAGAGGEAPQESGGQLDIDLDQLLACGSVDPAEGSYRPPMPRVSVAPGGAGRPGRLRGLTRRVAFAVAQLRGLRFERPIEVAFLGDAALRRRLTALSRPEYGARRAALAARILTALGALPPGTDLRELAEETLAGQVAGLYVPGTKELLVRSSDGDPGTLEILTVAHELEHALADQALGLPVSERPDPRRADAAGARLALVEGDATLAMQLFSQEHLSLADRLSLLGEASLGRSQAQFDELPAFLQRQLLFPYTEGLSFVCERASDGGMRAIDRAYAHPPRSTWEILFPDEDPDGRPADPPALGSPPKPWRLAMRTQLGAAPLLWLLEAPGGDAAAAVAGAENAVAEWRGDELALWTDGRRSAVGLAIATRGEGLCSAIGHWYRATTPGAAVARAASHLVFDGERQDAVVSCRPGSVHVGIAPDLRTAGLTIGLLASHSTAAPAASSGAAG